MVNLITVPKEERLWLLLRVIAGATFIPHGLQKLFGILGSPGTAILAASFEKAGLHPGAQFVTLIGAAELLSGLGLVSGLFTRAAACGAMAVLLGAMILVNSHFGFFWTKGGIEYSLMWSVLCLCFAIRGAGPVSLDASLSTALARGKRG